MAEIGRWNSHKFEVSPDVIRGFTGLTIKGSCDTEGKKKDKADYVSRKGGKPVEVSITVNLNQALNVDVRGEAIAFVEEALAGASDYFYVGSKKLVKCKLMLTDAQVKETIIPVGDTWLKADVQLTMKQCDKYDEISDSGKKKKRKKKSKKKKNNNTTIVPPGKYDDVEVDAVTGADPVAKKQVNDALSETQKWKSQADKNVDKARQRRQEQNRKAAQPYFRKKSDEVRAQKYMRGR